MVGVHPAPAPGSPFMAPPTALPSFSVDAPISCACPASEAGVSHSPPRVLFSLLLEFPLVLYLAGVSAGLGSLARLGSFVSGENGAHQAGPIGRWHLSSQCPGPERRGLHVNLSPPLVSVGVGVSPWHTEAPGQGGVRLLGPQGGWDRMSQVGPPLLPVQLPRT